MQYSKYKFEWEVFPDVIGVGDCLNVSNCKAVNVDLADGWCVNCWDKGDDAKETIKVNAERIKVAAKQQEEIKELERIIEESRRKLLVLKPRSRGGRHIKDCQCPKHLGKGFV